MCGTVWQVYFLTPIFHDVKLTAEHAAFWDELTVEEKHVAALLKVSEFRQQVRSRFLTAFPSLCCKPSGSPSAARGCAHVRIQGVQSFSRRWR